MFAVKYWNIQAETGESEFPYFLLNFYFENFENETPNKRVKQKLSEEEFDKRVEDQKNINTSRSTQFALIICQA